MGSQEWVTLKQLPWKVGMQCGKDFLVATELASPCLPQPVYSSRPKAMCCKGKTVHKWLEGMAGKSGERIR